FGVSGPSRGFPQTAPATLTETAVRALRQQEDRRHHLGAVPKRHPNAYADFLFLFRAFREAGELRGIRGRVRGVFLSLATGAETGPAAYSDPDSSAVGRFIRPLARIHAATSRIGGR